MAWIVCGFCECGTVAGEYGPERCWVCRGCGEVDALAFVVENVSERDVVAEIIRRSDESIAPELIKAYRDARRMKRFPVRRTMPAPAAEVA